MAEPTLEELKNQNLLLMKNTNLPNRTDLTYQDIYGFNTPPAIAYALSQSPKMEAAMRKEKGDKFTDEVLSYDWRSRYD
jgi:hypothetical protein